MFMIYPSSSEKNVTFSPRLATDHTEPEFYPGLDVETLANATGLMNETTYVYSGVCHNCRTWRGGSLDVNSTTQQFIFATGPGGDQGSDSDQASVKLHYEHGAFTMDMRFATGPAGPAVLNLASTDDNEGSVLVGEPVEGMNDYVALIHAVVMIGCFVGLMPFGILILRLGGWVRWHGLNQGVAMIGVIVGLGLGIKAGTLYNRVSSVLGNIEGLVDLLTWNGATDQEIQHSPPSHRYHRVHFHTGPVHVGRPAPPCFQKDPTAHQVCPHPRLAGQGSYNSGDSKCVPVCSHPFFYPILPLDGKRN